MTVIDFHVHAFPDALAPTAVSRLLADGGKRLDLRAHTDGTIAGLRASMKAAGIGAAVVANVATKPSQNGPILEWSRAVRAAGEGTTWYGDAGGPVLVPFPSVYPASPDRDAMLQRIAEDGFRGIKLHPFYQRAPLDSPEVLLLAKRAAALDLVVLCHCGYDSAFPPDQDASPRKLRALLDAVPGLKIVAAHLGGWKDWDAAREFLVGLPVYLDTSFSLPFMSEEAVLGILEGHPRDRLLFGTDSPWDDQAASLARVRDLSCFRDDPAQLELVLGGNARKLLGMAEGEVLGISAS